MKLDELGRTVLSISELGLNRDSILGKRKRNRQQQDTTASNTPTERFIPLLAMFASRLSPSRPSSGSEGDSISSQHLQQLLAESAMYIH